jgi:hypothetical protein
MWVGNCMFSQASRSRFGGALSVSDLQGVNESTQGSTKRSAYLTTPFATQEKL